MVNNKGNVHGCPVLGVFKHHFQAFVGDIPKSCMMFNLGIYQPLKSVDFGNHGHGIILVHHG